jgi:hypothetical protein
MICDLKEKLVYIIFGVIMINPCIAGDDLAPFLSNKDVYDYAKSLGENQVENINIVKRRIITTKDYFLKTVQPPNLSGFAPGESEWRKSRLVEALSMIKNCFGGIEIPLVCLGEIAEICALPNDSIEWTEQQRPDMSSITDKNFRYARFLIMSQCEKYDEGRSVFVLNKRPFMALLSEAIGILNSATNGDKGKSDALLASLKKSGKFEGFLG